VRLLVGAVDAQEFPDLESFVVSLAQYRDGDGWSISIQLPINVSSQDISLGQDTYAISTSDGITHYGGITSWSYSDGQIVLRLTEDAAAETALGEEVVLEFSGGREESEVVADGLAHILGPRI
jgi:hypothetical protein